MPRSRDPDARRGPCAASPCRARARSRAPCGCRRHPASSSRSSCRAPRPDRAMPHGCPRRCRCRPCSSRGPHRAAASIAPAVFGVDRPACLTGPYPICGHGAVLAACEDTEELRRPAWRGLGGALAVPGACRLALAAGDLRQEHGPFRDGEMPRVEYRAGRRRERPPAAQAAASLDAVAVMPIAPGAQRSAPWAGLRRICIEESGLAVPGQGRMALGICRPARLLCEPRGGSLGAVAICHAAAPQRPGRPCRRGLPHREGGTARREDLAGLFRCQPYPNRAPAEDLSSTAMQIGLVSRKALIAWSGLPSLFVLAGVAPLTL